MAMLKVIVRAFSHKHTHSRTEGIGVCSCTAVQLYSCAALRNPLTLIGEIGLISPDFTLFQSYGDIRVRREADSVASLNLSFLGSATKMRSADYRAGIAQ